MSQTFFSKLSAEEKQSRLSTLGSSHGEVTLWIKGSKDKKVLKVKDFDRERTAIVLESQDDLFPLNTQLLCTFEMRGMNFFSQVSFQKSIGGYSVIQFSGDFFKSERRNSYRLLTFPLYEVWAEFDLGEEYQGGNVVGLKNRVSQTGIFKNFLNLVNENKETETTSTGELKIRVQDLSTTGMAIHIGELESAYFCKDRLFEKVNIRFTDEVIQIPLVKAMYIVPYVGPDKNLKKFKVGLHFEDLPLNVDQSLGKKINQLLRANDKNKDFENFIK